LLQAAAAASEGGPSSLAGNLLGFFEVDYVTQHPKSAPSIRLIRKAVFSSDSSVVQWMNHTTRLPSFDIGDLSFL
jgi:hypothetical protein